MYASHSSYRLSCLGQENAQDVTLLHGIPQTVHSIAFTMPSSLYVDGTILIDASGYRAMPSSRIGNKGLPSSCSKISHSAVSRPALDQWFIMSPGPVAGSGMYGFNAFS